MALIAGRLQCLSAQSIKERVDLTKEKAYTLSPGTRAILQTRYAGEDPLLLHPE